MWWKMMSHSGFVVFLRQHYGLSQTWQTHCTICTKQNMTSFYCPIDKQSYILIVMTVKYILLFSIEIKTEGGFVFATSDLFIAWEHTWAEYNLPVNNAHFVKIVQSLKNLPKNSSNENFTHSLRKTRFQHVGTRPWTHVK